MFCASRFALGTMIVSQLRVSTTVWRQRIATTLPCWPSASWTQSPTWMRSVELERDAAEDVPQRGLKAEREHAADDAPTSSRPTTPRRPPP